VSRPCKSDPFAPATPTDLFVGAAGLVASEHATIGAAPSPAAPIKKIVPLLQTIFNSSCSADPKICSSFLLGG